MASIFVVMGSSGEYSDRSEWPVYYFTEKYLAEEFITKTEYEYNKYKAAVNTKKVRPDRTRTHEQNQALWDAYQAYRNAVKKECLTSMRYAFEYDDPYDWDDTGWYVIEVKPGE